MNTFPTTTQVMKHLQVYDPPMCCSTGVCGPDVDPALPVFAGMLQQFKNKGVVIERYNLAQQPLAFVQGASAKHRSPARWRSRWQIEASGY
jgi:hypothetical protein